MINRKRTWLLTTTTVVLALLSGCGAEDPADEPEVISVVEDDPVIMVHDGQNLAIADTTTGGELQFDATTGCLYLHNPHATEATRIGPLWPPGTEPVLVDGKRGVDLPGAGVITEGDHASLHGAPDDPELYSEWTDLFGRCWPEQTWVLVVGGPSQG